MSAFWKAIGELLVAAVHAGWLHCQELRLQLCCLRRLLLAQSGMQVQ
jgi:hypothetical protein